MNRILRWGGFATAIGLSVGMLFFVVSCTWIGYSVKDHCRQAQQAYGGDCVEALSKMLEDENRTYGERNTAIWALGQLGDKRALPLLSAYYTGEIPDREPWNGTISQYELKKAVNLAGGGFNISAVIWRVGY